jgi:FkbM family methyltransferase
MKNEFPPKQIPGDLLDSYTLNGKIPVNYWYLDDTCSSGNENVFKKSDIDSYLDGIKNRKTHYYGDTDSWLYQALDKYSIIDKEVAIIGSVLPLYECICLFYGGRPTTIDYNRVISEDPRIRTMTLDEFNKQPLKFDAAFSISTFEHDGLGRYGDPLNPYGDIEAMAKMKSVVKPSGLLFLAVPLGADTVVWNSHRVYGSLRLPKLLSQWRVLDIFPRRISCPKASEHFQPLFVLKNSEPRRFNVRMFLFKFKITCGVQSIYLMMVKLFKIAVKKSFWTFGLEIRHSSKRIEPDSFRNCDQKVGKISYSQCGEDLIIDYIFNVLQISRPSYLDIGAYHPIHLSNTYLFYQKGSQGVCVEPDPTLFSQLTATRKRDVCLNVGIGTGKFGIADFYIMSSKVLSTFSKEQADRYQSYGTDKIEKVIQVPLITLNNIIMLHFDRCPNFVSLDVEGLETEILKTFDFSRFRPEIFCVETVTYTEDKTEEKVTDTIDYMVSKGYFVFSDTYINSIFVDQTAWKSRP